MSFFGGITNIFTGGGALGSLVRTVAMGYIVKKLSNSATKENETGSRNVEQKNAPGIDNGVRLQVPPAADEKIPVLYGSAFFGGIISDAVMSNNNQRMHYVLTLAEKTGTLYSNSAVTSYGFGSIFYNDQTVTFNADGVTINYTTDRSGNRDDSLNGLVKIYCYAGGSASANQRFPTGTSGTAVNAYSVVSGWTSAHAMNNLVFAVVEVNYSAERNIKGIGDVKFQVTSSMNKPGDVIYDYATNNLYGANIANTEIDTTTITALNSYSANSVTYIDENSVSQTLTNRYQINGLVNTDNAVMKNVEELTSSAGSWLSYSLVTGKWSLIVNRAGTSVASFDDTNILGTVSVSGTGLQDLYNSVKTEFPNRDIRDGTDYVQLSIAAGDRNANEPNNTLNISYNFLNEPVQAQLLGFIELKQSRIDLVITFQSDYTTLNLVPGDIIDVTNSVLGFTNKLFRIITVAEVDGDQGLQSEITALEYDSTVYNEDLSRVTRTVTNGFTTTGNIGRPGTPTIAKFEDDARPRIEISTTTPTGTVEGIEYWLSNDVALGEAQRNYRLIDTRQPSGGNANVRGTFTTGETVTLDYDNIGTSNLVVKTRAYNSTTVGPYSANSAVTTFTSTQTTDAIGPDTKAYDELGGLMTALSVVSLLNKLDGLFGGNATPGSMFKKIFDIFTDETGYDIVGETAGGNLIVSSILGVKDEGTTLTNAVSTINFTGSAVSATVANSSQVTVTVTDGLSSTASAIGTSPEHLASSSLAGGAPTHFIYGDIASIFGSRLSGLNYTNFAGQNDSRVGIWTHPALVFSTKSMTSSGINQRSAGTLSLAFDVSGTAASAGPPVGSYKIKFFDAGSYWQSINTTPPSINPNYTNLNLFASVNSAKSGNIQMYYAICDNVDTSKTISNQSWGPWQKYSGQTNSIFTSTNLKQVNKNISLSKNSYHTCLGSTFSSAGAGDLGFNKSKIKFSSAINLSANSAIIFGLSVFNFQSNVAFSANTILNTGCNIYEFPGYTPTSGNTAIILQGGPIAGQFISGKSDLSNTPTTSSVWPDTYQFGDTAGDWIRADMGSVNEWSISSYPTDIAYVDIRVLG